MSVRGNRTRLLCLARKIHSMGIRVEGHTFGGTLGITFKFPRLDPNRPQSAATPFYQWLGRVCVSVISPKCSNFILFFTYKGEKGPGRIWKTGRSVAKNARRPSMPLHWPCTLMPLHSEVSHLQRYMAAHPSCVTGLITFTFTPRSPGSHALFSHLTPRVANFCHIFSGLNSILKHLHKHFKTGKFHTKVLIFHFSCQIRRFLHAEASWRGRSPWGVVAPAPLLPVMLRQQVSLCFSLLWHHCVFYRRDLFLRACTSI